MQHITGVRQAEPSGTTTIEGNLKVDHDKMMILIDRDI